MVYSSKYIHHVFIQDFRIKVTRGKYLTLQRTAANLFD